MFTFVCGDWIICQRDYLYNINRVIAVIITITEIIRMGTKRSCVLIQKRIKIQSISHFYYLLLKEICSITKRYCSICAPDSGLTATLKFEALLM